MIKVDKPQLAKIIKEVIDDMDAHNSHEGSMARSQLGRTAEIAAMLQDMIDDNTNLDEWVESKITKAQDYLTTVLNYMRGQELSEDKKYKPSFYKSKEKRAEKLIKKGVPEDVAYGVADKQMAKKGKKKRK
jgi:hypothetical protein